jgi:hypothetical protein
MLKAEILIYVAVYTVSVQNEAMNKSQSYSILSFLVTQK